MAEHESAQHDAHDAHAEHGHNPLGPEHLFGHIKDSDHFELPRALGGKIAIPQWRDADAPPIFQVKTGFAPLDSRILPLDLKVTKFMVLEVVAAVILVALMAGLASRIKKGAAPKGPLTNLLEAMILFIRNDVARPAIGHHDADRFLPFLLTAFFFVAACNLLGMVPWAGSATGALGATIALALITFATVVVAGMAKLGPIGFWLAQVPHIELSPALSLFLKPGIFFIEVMGLGIKHFVLAMRLFANMMAGHLVLAVLLAFIAATWSSWAVYGVAPASVVGAVALSLLELFVALLQAYVFTFLSALFIGMAVHPH
jgi:F-type H+-transporting ATPase subunit a